MLPSSRPLQALLIAISRHSLSRRRVPSQRLLTQNAQLFILSSHDPRPQLPFLHSPHFPHLSRHRSQNQLSRLLTTETRAFIRDSAKTLGWTTVAFWTFVGLFTIAKFGLDNEILERKHPSPEEWSFISKWRYRNAKGYENPDHSKIVDWARVGSHYKPLIARLENSDIDGAGTRPPLGNEEDIYVEGIGKMGLDITQKSEPWRRAYHDALMGAARTAEHLETWLLDRTRGYVFPPEVVIGPSNPRPRPVPFGAKSAPREEDCEPAYELPHVYYMKVLTTRGFTSRQRLDAALAYADWLRYKGLKESAEDMYAWALDIAVAGMPPEADPVDKKTGTIKNIRVSTNVLLATTSLATHHALVGNLATALPIFLSILRAQQSLPPPTPVEQQSALADSTHAKDSILGMLQSVLSPPSYPPPPPSGDEAANRTPAMICAEGGTMVHIGEILYSSSSQLPSSTSVTADPTPPQAAGLSWTRDGVDLAEETLRSLSTTLATQPLLNGAPSREAQPLVKPGRMKMEAKKRCAECLTAGMSNWTTMVRRHQLAEEELARASQSKKLRTKAETRDTKEWFWRKDAGLAQADTVQGEGRWAAEAKRTAQRSLDVQRLLREEGLDK